MKINSDKWVERTWNLMLGNIECFDAICPYCGEDLLYLIWEQWSGKGSEHFDLICPDCGNNVVVTAKLSFDITKQGG